MNHLILPDGDLMLQASNVDRAYLAEIYADQQKGHYVAEMLVSEAFREILTFIVPENIGALTDAPILTDEADYDEEQHGFVPYPDANVWWFPNYAITDPWEELKNTGRVIFTLAKKKE